MPSYRKRWLYNYGSSYWIVLRLMNKYRLSKLIEQVIVISKALSALIHLVHLLSFHVLLFHAVARNAKRNARSARRNARRAKRNARKIEHWEYGT